MPSPKRLPIAQMQSTISHSLLAEPAAGPGAPMSHPTPAARLFTAAFLSWSLFRSLDAPEPAVGVLDSDPSPLCARVMAPRDKSNSDMGASSARELLVITFLDEGPNPPGITCSSPCASHASSCSASCLDSDSSSSSHRRNAVGFSTVHKRDDIQTYRSKLPAEQP